MRLKGLEPLTFWSATKRSIQLSYRRVFVCNENKLYHNFKECASRLRTVKWQIKVQSAFYKSWS
jgi:hypothetical protein